VELGVGRNDGSSVVNVNVIRNVVGAASKDAIAARSKGSGFHYEKRVQEDGIHDVVMVVVVVWMCAVMDAFFICD